MVAAQSQKSRPLLNDLRRMCFDRVRDGRGFAVIEEAVSDIGHCQLVERVELHTVRLFPGHDR